MTIGGTSYRSQGSAYHAAQELHKVRASAALNHQVHLQIHKDTEVVTDSENVRLFGFFVSIEDGMIEHWANNSLGETRW